MKIKLIFLGCLVAISTSLWAMDAGEFRGETKAKIEILQKQNDQVNTKIDSMEKDIRDEYKTITDRQNERISDIENHFNIFLAILGIFAAIAGYLTFKKSKELALTEVKDWLEKNGDSIKTTMAQFETELEVFKKQTKDATDEHNKKLVATRLEAENELQKLQQKIQKGKIDIEEDKKSDHANALETIAQSLREKPQSEYTFADWNKLAFDAYNKKQQEDALFYWRKAIEITQQASIQKAWTFFNIGITLNNLNRYEDEINAYNELIYELKGTQDEALQALKAKAMVYKGMTFNLIEKTEAAIAIYTEVLNELHEAKNDILNEQRALAYINLLEVQLIVGQEIKADYDEELNQYINNHKQDKLQVNMLLILQDALKSDQQFQLINLRKEFEDTNFGEWRWYELDRWASNITDIQKRKRINETLDYFKNWAMTSRSNQE